MDLGPMLRTLGHSTGTVPYEISKSNKIANPKAGYRISGEAGYRYPVKFFKN
jgi:hypothetical protein